MLIGWCVSCVCMVVMFGLLCSVGGSWLIRLVIVCCRFRFVVSVLVLCWVWLE